MSKFLKSLSTHLIILKIPLPPPSFFQFNPVLPPTPPSRYHRPLPTALPPFLCLSLPLFLSLTFSLSLSLSLPAALSLCPTPAVLPKGTTVARLRVSECRKKFGGEDFWYVFLGNFTREYINHKKIECAQKRLGCGTSSSLILFINLLDGPVHLSPFIPLLKYLGLSLLTWHEGVGPDLKRPLYESFFFATKKSWGWV